MRTVKRSSRPAAIRGNGLQRRSSEIIRSRSISLILVRWPLPFDLSQSRTSASIRTVVCFLTGRKNSSRRIAVAHRSGGSGLVSGSASRPRSRFSYSSRDCGLILRPFLKLTGVRSLLIFICLPCGNDADDFPPSSERSTNTATRRGSGAVCPMAW